MNTDNIIIKLLEYEVRMLRSVLSEFEGDKSEYVCMHTANRVREAIELLEELGLTDSLLKSKVE